MPWLAGCVKLNQTAGKIQNVLSRVQTEVEVSCMYYLRAVAEQEATTKQLIPSSYFRDTAMLHMYKSL